METPARTNIPSGSGISMTGEGALTRAASGVHGAVDKIAGAADEAVRSVKPAIGRVAAIAHQAVDQAASAAAPGAEWLSTKGESLKATKRMLVDDTCRLVAANPLKSIGMALAVGFLISRMMR